MRYAGACGHPFAERRHLSADSLAPAPVRSVCMACGELILERTLVAEWLPPRSPLVRLD